MFTLLRIIIVAGEAIGERLSRKKPKTAEEIKRERIRQRNDQIATFLWVFILTLGAVVILIMIWK